MRRSNYLLFLLVIVSSCKSVAYFNTSNDVFRKEAAIYLVNGTKKNGQLTIRPESGYGGANFILLKNGIAEEKILLDSVLFYSIGNDHYYLKKIDVDLSGKERLLFVKELTKENSRIKLYELFEQKNKTPDGADHFSYFISLPAHRQLQTWNIGSRNLVPNFEDKMSKVVEDCPALADKIKGKTKGYFIAEFITSDQKKLEIMERIIQEYNDCR